MKRARFSPCVPTLLSCSILEIRGARTISAASEKIEIPRQRLQNQHRMEGGESMDQARILEEIKAAAIDNRLSCEKAHALAGALGISLRELGTLCNQLKIKISACQLGCF
jgi:hypothetical protein